MMLEPPPGGARTLLLGLLVRKLPTFYIWWCGCWGEWEVSNEVAGV